MSDLLKKLEQYKKDGRIQSPFQKFSDRNPYSVIQDEQTAVKRSFESSKKELYSNLEIPQTPLSQPYYKNPIKKLDGTTNIIRNDSRLLPIGSLTRDAQRIGKLLFSAGAEVVKFVKAISGGDLLAITKLKSNSMFMLTYSAMSLYSPYGKLQGAQQIARHLLGYVTRSPINSLIVMNTVFPKRNEK